MSDDIRRHRWGKPKPPEKRGYGQAHRKIRKQLLAEEPFCRECAKRGKQTKATHADHVIPLCLNGPTVRSNYQPLCLVHSRSKTGREGAMMRIAKKRARQNIEGASDE